MAADAEDCQSICVNLQIYILTTCRYGFAWLFLGFIDAGIYRAFSVGESCVLALDQG